MARNGEEGGGGRGNKKVDERKDDLLGLPEVEKVKAPRRRKSQARPATGSPPRSARSCNCVPRSNIPQVVISCCTKETQTDISYIQSSYI